VAVVRRHVAEGLILVSRVTVSVRPVILLVYLFFICLFRDVTGRGEEALCNVVVVCGGHRVVISRYCCSGARDFLLTRPVAEISM